MAKSFILVFLAVAFFAGAIWGLPGFLLVIALQITIALGALFFLQARVTVGELETLVILRDGGLRFSRFLPAGQHWLNPLTERVGPVIPTSGQMHRGRCQKAQTCGGLPVSVDWVVLYRLNPVRIDRRRAAGLARLLPEKSGKIVEQNANHLLHHEINRITIEELLESGIHEKLERALRLQLRARLESAGFEISRVMIEAIHKPAPVVAALEAVHEQELRTAQETASLTRLQAVISRFSDEDMDRLLALERIHALGRNGAIWVEGADRTSAHDLAAALFERKRTRETIIVDP